MILEFTLVNEDGEQYDHFDNWDEAREMLERFPNDTVVVKVISVRPAHATEVR